MVDDDWAIRAQATTEREEIQLLRGAVAALRATRAGGGSARGEGRTRTDARSGTEARTTLPVVVAFLLGVVVTSASIALFSAALCP